MTLMALVVGSVLACVPALVPPASNALLPSPVGSDPGLYPFVGVFSVGATAHAARARADYPEVFTGVDDPNQTGELDVRGLRQDLVRIPVGEGNYRALYAVAVAFFVLHERAEQVRGGQRYLVYSFQATKMIAIPWRFYGDIPEPQLRATILDFYEDVMFGDKPGLDAVRGRYTRVVADLVRKETDDRLRSRIEGLVVRARALTPEPGG